MSLQWEELGRLKRDLHEISSQINSCEYSLLNSLMRQVEFKQFDSLPDNLAQAIANDADLLVTNSRGETIMDVVLHALRVGAGISAAYSGVLIESLVQVQNKVEKSLSWEHLETLENEYAALSTHVEHTDQVEYLQGKIKAYKHAWMRYIIRQVEFKEFDRLARNIAEAIYHNLDFSTTNPKGQNILYVLEHALTPRGLVRVTEEDARLLLDCLCKVQLHNDMQAEVHARLHP